MSLSGRMNLLVTGGAGFIGSAYVRLARRRRPGDPVVNVDALTYAGNLENLRDLENDPAHQFVRADNRDGAAMLELMPRHAVPRYLRFMDELPKTPTQRIQKFRLREDGVTTDAVDREALGIHPPRE